MPQAKQMFSGAVLYPIHLINASEVHGPTGSVLGFHGLTKSAVKVDWAMLNMLLVSVSTLSGIRLLGMHLKLCTMAFVLM